ncbi:MAG: SPOR domain-containing protein [Gallionella sp.]|nr:SPOR domain-containing protein [Gallionella sp.]
MMRTLFWILLLVNLVFFAMMQWGGRLTSGEQAVQAQPALYEDKISLLNASQSGSITALPAPASAATSVGDPTQLAAKPENLCMEWGDFSGEDLARVTTALSALQLGEKSSQRQIEHNIGYWVYIPPIKDKAVLAQKIAQLKTRGVKEYFVVPEAGQWQNAISLGIFKTQEAAQNFFDDLRTKGVRSAKVGERASKLKATIFMLNGLDAATGAKLTEMQKDFAGSELKKIPCAH